MKKYIIYPLANLPSLYAGTSLNSGSGLSTYLMIGAVISCGYLFLRKKKSIQNYNKKCLKNLFKDIFLILIYMENLHIEELKNNMKKN